MGKMKRFHFHSSALRQALQSKHCAERSRSSAGLVSPSRAAGTNAWLRRELRSPGSSTSSSAFEKNGKQLTGFFHCYSNVLIPLVEMLPVQMDLKGFCFMEDYQSSPFSPDIWKKYGIFKKLNTANSTCSATLNIRVSWHSKYRFLPTRKESSKNAQKIWKNFLLKTSLAFHLLKRIFPVGYLVLLAT